MALAGGGSRRSKKARRAKAAGRVAMAGPRAKTEKDLARSRAVRRFIARSKTKKLPSACAAFVHDIENAFDAAGMIKSKKLRKAAGKAADKASERGIKAGCYRGRMDPS